MDTVRFISNIDDNDLNSPELTSAQMRNLLYIESLLWVNANHKGPALDGRKAQALVNRGLVEKFKRSKRRTKESWSEFQITDKGRAYLGKHVPDEILDDLYRQLQSDFVSPLDPRKRAKYTKQDLPD